MGKSFVYNTGASDDDKKENEIRLEFGVFIDGTLNNKDNTALREKYDGKNTVDLTPKEIEEDKKRYLKARNDDPKEYKQYKEASKKGTLEGFSPTSNSFENGDTNVARKWKCCKKDYRIYIPGMGTSDVETQGIAHDDDDGFQYGAGNVSGIRVRVRLACELVAEKIHEKVKNITDATKSIEVTIDVFGFSRGAASARNFVYEITKGEYTPGDIEVSYTETIHHPERAELIDYSKIRDNPYEPSEKPKNRLQHYKAYTTTEKKKKIVKRADSDGLMTDPKLYLDGKLPRMGHLGYSLRKLKIKPEQLEKIELKVRFLGIYDTVSSYEEWGAIAL